MHESAGSWQAVGIWRAVCGRAAGGQRAARNGRRAIEWASQPEMIALHPKMEVLFVRNKRHVTWAETLSLREDKT